MGMNRESFSDDNKQNITMGYSSMYPPQPPAPYPPPSAGVIYPVPCGPQGYTPHPYAPTSTYPYPSPYQQDPSQYPYPGPPYDNNNNGFYYPQHHYNTLVLPEKRNGLSFGRLMVAIMFCLIASMCLMSLLMWILFGAYAPDLEIASLRVSNFSVTDTDLTGTWKISMKVSNNNKDLGLQFDPVMSSVLYKEVLLGVSAVKPFDVLQTQSTDLNFAVPTEQTAGGEGTGKLQESIKPTLKEDFNNGLVVFSLRMAMKVTFTNPSKVHRQVKMRLLCENMQVRFAAGTGEGSLLPVTENTCLLRINEKLKEE